MKTLNTVEVENVNGGIWGNVAGAAIGGVTGFYTGIISGGTTATGRDILKSTVAGAVTGAFSPVKAVGTAVAAVGGGLAGSAASSLL